MHAPVKKTSKSESEGGGLANLATERPARIYRLTATSIRTTEEGSTTVGIKRIVVCLLLDQKTVARTAGEAPKSRLPWDSAPYTSASD
jgi:hypothetical protein